MGRLVRLGLGIRGPARFRQRNGFRSLVANCRRFQLRPSNAKLLPRTARGGDNLIPILDGFAAHLGSWAVLLIERTRYSQLPGMES